MNVLFRFVLAALFVPGPAIACNAVFVRRVVKQQVVVTPAFVAVQPVVFPLYQASYSPNYQQNSVDGFQLVADEIKLLREEVARLKGAPNATEQQASFAQVLTDSCLKCHAAAVAKDKGGDFTLIDKDNKLAPLSVQEKARIKNRVTAGSMPPKSDKPLTDAEKKAVVEGLR